ncbi:hypothetical protein HZ326_20806 [Fusarium oxysporum f. sp. albedinis]|nr:hypothetical protein HZ326_20806 [Fusarium oxysporum f. sp. albedinis]
MGFAGKDHTSVQYARESLEFWTGIFLKWMQKSIIDCVIDKPRVFAFGNARNLGRSSHRTCSKSPDHPTQLALVVSEKYFKPLNGSKRAATCRYTTYRELAKFSIDFL